jgi:hypothetical protein
LGGFFCQFGVLLGGFGALVLLFVQLLLQGGKTDIHLVDFAIGLFLDFAALRL